MTHARARRVTASGPPPSRGQGWFTALTGRKAARGAIQVADCRWGGAAVRVLAITPNPRSRYPRARNGEMGIEEGWQLASRIHEAVREDESGEPRALVAVVDAPGQAFGATEERLGLHQSLAAAVNAYATARGRGHPVVALVVGRAISGAFLAHGLQAGAVLAFADPGVEVHVMSRASVARVTRRSADEVERLARKIPTTARDVHAFASLGGVDRLLEVASPDQPAPGAIEEVRRAVLNAIAELRRVPRGPRDRLDQPAAAQSRRLSRLVRERIAAAWHEAADAGRKLGTA